jgi:hypothetical protein
MRPVHAVSQVLARLGGGPGGAEWATGWVRAVGSTDRVIDLYSPVSSRASAVPAAPGSAPNLA